MTTGEIVFGAFIAISITGCANTPEPTPSLFRPTPPPALPLPPDWSQLPTSTPETSIVLPTSWPTNTMITYYDGVTGTAYPCTSDQLTQILPTFTRIDTALRALAHPGIPLGTVNVVCNTSLESGGLEVAFMTDMQSMDPNTLYVGVAPDATPELLEAKFAYFVSLLLNELKPKTRRGYEPYTLISEAEPIFPYEVDGFALYPIVDKVNQMDPERTIPEPINKFNQFFIEAMTDYVYRQYAIYKDAALSSSDDTPVFENIHRGTRARAFADFAFHEGEIQVQAIAFAYFNNDLDSFFNLLGFDNSAQIRAFSAFLSDGLPDDLANASEQEIYEYYHQALWSMILIEAEPET